MRCSGIISMMLGIRRPILSIFCETAIKNDFCCRCLSPFSNMAGTWSPRRLWLNRKLPKPCSFSTFKKIFLFQTEVWWLGDYKSVEMWMVLTTGFEQPVNEQCPVRIGYLPDESLDCRTCCLAICTLKENLILSYLIITRDVMHVPEKHHHSCVLWSLL